LSINTHETQDHIYIHEVTFNYLKYLGPLLINISTRSKNM